MAQYRNRLPQLEGGAFLSDGGLETTLIFHDSVHLPHFASFVLLADPSGRQRLAGYYRRYLTLARRAGIGFVLDTPTWRASPDWGAALAYDLAALAAANADAVALMSELRHAFESPDCPCVISGVIGPRGDGYRVGEMTAAAAEDYHAWQIACFAGTAADMVTAYTLTTTTEAIGIARAAAANGLPCALSFTVETDGRLAGGESLQAAIETVDDATGGSPAYFMVNCAHPIHVLRSLGASGAWRARILGVKANASTKSHAELDNATTLDDGDPTDFGARFHGLRDALPAMRLFGGCCGTDHRHAAAICEACFAPQGAA
ncbi:MAG TPA: homocysteine S-methyltransferase family protein [Acetobacteraceae bacterium]|nr:homocysteine S-methyltransferase family protein [Acetobacteraceae bacterium]